MLIFTKKYQYLDPPEFFENENFDAYELACTENLDFASNLIPDLWLSALFCQIKNIKITPPYCACPDKIKPLGLNGILASVLF